ncbi:MAG TPA: HAD-IA family hydrolase [Burkholderiaceae bacterium]|nr:HAD-IA family hydrolase [Burkholderiaceae bacterium]
MSEKRYDVVVFDWDGTLVDSTSAIAQAILQAAADVGTPVPDPAKASHVIGLGLAQALAGVVPHLPPERFAEFAARYREHYSRSEGRIQLFEGAAELLQTLRERNVRLAIATGKTLLGLQRALKNAGLQEYFCALRCADQTHPKPHPAMLEELAQELDADRASMLMIGDTTHDLLMASSAGVAAVAVCYGAHARAELERLAPLALFDSLWGLRQWLLERC